MTCGIAWLLPAQSLRFLLTFWLCPPVQATAHFNHVNKAHTGHIDEKVTAVYSTSDCASGCAAHVAIAYLCTLQRDTSTMQADLVMQLKMTTCVFIITARNSR